MPRSAPVNLTDLKVKALRPDLNGEYVQGDTQVPGFGVRVRPSGAASYVVIKRLPGNPRSMRITIGRVVDIKLAAAREKARDIIGAVRTGVDVNAEKRRAQRASRRAQAETGYRSGTFGETAIGYVNSECAALARGAEVEAVIRRHLLPAWGDRQISELRRRDLTALLDPIVDAGRTQAAHKLREVAIRVVNWAIDRGDVEINLLATPSRGRRRTDIIRRSRRERVLASEEIRAVWQACTCHPFGTIVKLALLLGQRRDEIAGMEWAELDLDGALWIIPAGRYKTRMEHVVPLPRLAVELIRATPRTCDCFVFSTRPGTRFSGYAKAKARLDIAANVQDWRIHDLRRTVRTGLSAAKVSADTAERVLGHVLPGVRGVYDRHAYREEKRDALERWAARLANIVESPTENVIELRAARNA